MVMIFFFVTIPVYAYYNQEVFFTLGNLNWYNIAILLLLRFLLLIINGLFLKTFTAKLSIHLSPVEWIGLPFITSMGNYIFPLSAGMVARAVYLKNKHTLPYTQFLMLLLANYILSFWTISFIGFFSILLAHSMTENIFWIQAFLLFVLLATSAILLFPNLTFPVTHRLFNSLNIALEGWQIVRNDLRVLLTLILYTTLQALLNGFTVYLSFSALKSPVAFIDALLIGILVFFSLLVNITPGNIGIQESLTTFSAVLLGSGFEYSLLVSLIIRATNMIVAFGFGPIFSYLLRQKF